MLHHETGVDCGRGLRQIAGMKASRKHQPVALGAYIVADPKVCHGKPTFKGTRVMVFQVLEQVASGTPTNGSGFYRVKGLRGLAASLSAANQTTDEGTFTGPVLVFNGLYSGTVHYTWNGTNTGTLRLTNVTTAVIPSAGSSWSDDTGVSQLQYLTLRLDAGTNYGLGSILTQTIGVEENDADWQGILQTDSGSLNFVLRLARDANGLQGWLRSDQAGFFPTNTPGAPVAQLAFTTSAFTAVVTNIPLPAQAGSPLFSVSNRVTLRLVASGATNVTPSW